MKGKREERKGDTGKEKVRGENKNKMRGEIVAGLDAGGWRRGGEEGGEAPGPAPSGVIGSWTANLSQLNQQQQR